MLCNANKFSHGILCFTAVLTSVTSIVTAVRLLTLPLFSLTLLGVAVFRHLSSAGLDRNLAGTWPQNLRRLAACRSKCDVCSQPSTVPFHAKRFFSPILHPLVKQLCVNFFGIASTSARPTCAANRNRNLLSGWPRFCFLCKVLLQYVCPARLVDFHKHRKLKRVGYCFLVPFKQPVSLAIAKTGTNSFGHNVHWWHRFIL